MSKTTKSIREQIEARKKKSREIIAYLPHLSECGHCYGTYSENADECPNCGKPTNRGYFKNSFVVVSFLAALIIAAPEPLDNTLITVVVQLLFASSAFCTWLYSRTLRNDSKLTNKSWYYTAWVLAITGAAAAILDSIIQLPIF